MATYLTRTPSSSGSNTTWTFSCWFKKTSIGLDTVPFATGYTSPQIDEAMINIGADDQLRFNIAINDATDVTVKSSRKLRDVNAWYHIVVACDTTQNTASNRIKFYINGEQETNLSNTDYPTQGQSTYFGDSNKAQLIGRQPRSSNYLFGVMSHVHFCDGTQLAPTVFGETDSTTGEWKIKPSPSFTLGTNGFTILKDGNTITDQSTNSNHWSLGGGTLTKTEDCPANVFATWNALIPDVATLSNGNTTSNNTSSSNWNRASCTLADTKGKYYAEFKMTTIEASQVGIIDVDQAYGTTAQPRNSSRAYMYKENGQKGNNSSDSSYGATYTDGDIIGVAVDLDNNKIYFSKNGVFQNSGVPTSGSTGTGSAFNLTDGYFYTFINGNYDSSGNGRIDANFGNGYFGTTAVATNSGNGYAGAEGKSIFNYQPPTGYSALSTKGLNL